MDYISIVCENIKDKRLELGYSQLYVAEQIGVLQPSYNRFESKKYNISLKTLIKISNVLKVNPKDLFEKKVE